MPLLKKTVYIREEDLELWAQCPNKSLMVHNALRTDWDKEMLVAHPPLTIKAGVSKNWPKKISEPRVEEKLLSIPGVVKGSEFVPKPPDPETGYPCCTKSKPCKHWIFDGSESVWRNELTGKTREVL